MRKNVTIKVMLLVVLLISLVVLGCSFSKDKVAKEPNDNVQMMGGEQQEEGKEGQITKEEETEKSTLAGIALDLPKDEVLKLLGTEYEEQYIDEGGYYLEPFYVWKYGQDIIVLIGAESEKVLEIEVNHPAFKTNLGVKVGDTSEVVSEKYGSLYTVPKSIHGGGKLEGWFNLEEDKLIIFDYDKDDESLVNVDVLADSQVEMIKLTYWKFFD